MEYSEILKRIESHFNFKSDKNKKEHHIIEKFLLDISNEKVTIFNIFKIVKKLKMAVTLIGTTACSCLSEQVDLGKTQLDCMQIQKVFQQEVDELKKKINNL